MPATRPVRVAASMIVFTSLLSDMVYQEVFFFNSTGIHDFFRDLQGLTGFYIQDTPNDSRVL